MFTRYITQTLSGALHILLVAGLMTGMLLAISPPNAALATSADDGFNPGANNLVEALALQADGKIVVGGWFTTLGGQVRNYIGRLNPDGTLDDAFDPGADGIVFALALQADGKILVGGRFTTLGGEARNYIARLSSDAAALQNLTLAGDGASLTWERSGAGPEVWRVTFEQSLDGVSYTPLGDGTRVSGGWQLSGLALPSGQNIWLRARGYYMSGLYNGSGSVIDSVRNVYLQPRIFLPLVSR
jgi:hypothetical protein